MVLGLSPQLADEFLDGFDGCRFGCVVVRSGVEIALSKGDSWLGQQMPYLGWNSTGQLSKHCRYYFLICLPVYYECQGSVCMSCSADPWLW